MRTVSSIYSKPADGRGDASQLLPLDSFHWLVGWTRDRPTLAYGVMEKTQPSLVRGVPPGPIDERVAHCSTLITMPKA